MNPRSNPPGGALNLWQVFGYALVAVISFQLAYSVKHCQVLFVFFLWALFQLVKVETARQAFYLGLAIGLACYAFQLRFFWTIFHVAAIPLYLILSFWLGLFLSLGRLCWRRFGIIGWACAAPFFWTGLEYFRSELYYLRFSWMNAGYAFSSSGDLPYVACYGVYGIGFVLMALAAFLGLVRRLDWPHKIAGGFVVAALLVYPAFVSPPRLSRQSVQITGVQQEFPIPAEAVMALNQAVAKFPETDLFILSEYTFTGPIPKLVKSWCRKHKKYLVVGGEDPISSSQYYNTVFVVNPDGEIAFKQAKCVPIQFFHDGLPANQQKVWKSPWGKLGLGVCYDDCYTRVTDKLVKEGAQLLIFPTMDIMDWGLHQHELHARMAPVRAAEYGVPVIRLCSSGISEYADASGKIQNSAPFPGQGEMIHAQIQLSTGGRIPPDRWLAIVCVTVTIALSAWIGIEPILFK